jgi:hypothetical protein
MHLRSHDPRVNPTEHIKCECGRLAGTRLALPDEVAGSEGGISVVRFVVSVAPP